MAKSENNLQLPVIILGGIIALVIKDIVQIALSIPLQKYLTGLQTEYQTTAAQGKAVPWWIENLSNIYALCLALGLALFALAFYHFVVKENPIRFGKKSKAESVATSSTKTVKKTVKKAKK